MTKILDRYASAVHSSNLASKPDTVYSDSDVLGAVGLAGKRNALAMALARVFMGDNGAAHDVARTLSEMAYARGVHLGVKLKRTQADDMARAVLAWKRDGKCKACGGHGFELIPGTTTVGGISCRRCRGTTMVPFDNQFAMERLPVARWLLAEIDREHAKAGAAAKAKLAPKHMP